MPSVLIATEKGRLARLAKQFSKFIVVGGINTAIDIAALNVQMVLTGISSGPWLILFNTVSFALAVTNSYFLNKYWTFEDKRHDAKEDTVKFSQFFGVSIVGAGINSGVVYGFTALIPPMFGLSQLLWTNVGKLFATGISLIWNFIGYKLWVFKR
jgi:putative flippase GtrA